MIESVITFDVETTGLHPIMERVIEIAAVRWAHGEPVETFQSLVRPNHPIDPRASEIHGMVDADVADAPESAAVLRDFCTFVGGHTLAAHNSPFDMAFLTMEALRSRITMTETTVIDTLPLSRRAFPSLPSHKLVYLSQVLGLGATQSHRALDDALTAGRLLHRAWQELGDIPRHCCAPFPSQPKLRLPKPIRTLRQAVEQQCNTIIDYVMPNGSTSEREIIPVEILEIMGKTYLFCRLCKADGTDEDRTYRVDRIRGVRAMLGV